MTFLVTFFPKNVTFWPRRYKLFLNAKKCDDSAGTETYFSLTVSDLSLIAQAWSGKAISAKTDLYRHVCESCHSHSYTHMWVLKYGICESIDIGYVSGTWLYKCGSCHSHSYTHMRESCRSHTYTFMWVLKYGIAESVDIAYVSGTWLYKCGSCHSHSYTHMRESCHSHTYTHVRESCHSHPPYLEGVASAISLHRVPFHMCDMTHSYAQHDSSIRVTWLAHMCDMTHLFGDIFALAACWHDAFIYAPWLIHVCAMTHWYVWHGSFVWAMLDIANTKLFKTFVIWDICNMNYLLWDSYD